MIFLHHSCVPLLCRSTLLILVSLSQPAWSGNPVPPDELSLLNGAESFKRFCTDCHGWDPDEQYTSMYSEDPTDDPDPLFENELPPPEEDYFVEIDDDWPEWAGPEPVEPIDQAPSLRSELLGDLNSAIDDFYSDDVEDTADWEAAETAAYAQSLEFDDAYADDFDRVDGATDLTNPIVYIYGTTEDDLFNHIAGGTGPTMQGFLRELGGEEGVWDVVNYIRSLWNDEWLE